MADIITDEMVEAVAKACHADVLLLKLANGGAS